MICYSPTQGSININIFMCILVLTLPYLGTACTNGAIRLTNGTTSNEGRVEYCYEGKWAPFCDISPLTASVVCNQLGYNYTCKRTSTFIEHRMHLHIYIDASIFDDERFGRSNALSTFHHTYCSGSEQYISQCTEVRKGSCYISYIGCQIEYGIRCYSKFFLNSFNMWYYYE